MEAVRSKWEESIEEYIKWKYPSLKIESNNRSIIPSRRTRSFNLEIDIFIPALCLGVEANGDAYHDRQEYLDDKAQGTAYSDEKYKEDFCNRVGIELVHVWSSEGMETIQSRIDDAIQRRLADPEIQEWDQARTSAVRVGVRDVLDSLGCLGTALMMCGVAGSSVSLLFVLFGGSGELDGGWLLPSFLVGAVGVLLPLLVNDEWREAARSNHDLYVRTPLGFLLMYSSMVLMGFAAMAGFPLLAAIINGWVGEFSGRLAVAAFAGIIGLILYRTLRERV